MNEKFAKEVFSKIGISKISKSLKTISPKTQEKLFSLLGNDDAGKIKNEMQKLGTLELREIEEIQTEILKIK
jgi:flagellar motor switch protein FliG